MACPMFVICRREYNSDTLEKRHLNCRWGQVKVIHSEEVADHVDLDKRAFCLIGGSLLVNLSRHSTMSSLIPGLSWFSRSSEKERGDTTHTRSGKGRRRTLSEPTPMDVDSEEGSRPKCSVCNGICISLTEMSR